MLIPPLDRVSRGLKESHSLFPSWGGLLVGGCCLTFTVCISLLELTWKLTAASLRASAPTCPPPSLPAVLGSPKRWPSPHLPPDLLVLHYLMHTNPAQTATECWGKVLTETYGCWWITCIIEGYENRLYPSVEMCDSQTPSSVLCARCCGRSPPVKRGTQIIPSSKSLAMWKHHVKAMFCPHQHSISRLC